MQFSHFQHKAIGFLLLLFIAGSVSFVQAEDLSSSNFIVRDPVIGTGGGYQSSGSFKLFGSGDESAIGSGSSTSFITRLGFLYYPYVAPGTLTATVNISDIDMSWVATSTALGFNVSGYKVGISNTSGGPYTFTTLGNVTTYTYTNRSPGTYYVVVQTLDAFGNTIAVSNEETETITPSISFTLSDNTIGFGTLTSATARYATGDGTGTSTANPAHTMSVATNGSTGYSVIYNGPALSSTTKTINGATITSDIDGVPGTEQFALSVTTSGDASIVTTYQKASNNWGYTSNTPTVIASESVPTSTETLSAYYLANISQQTNAGGYAATITYITTPNF